MLMYCSFRVPVSEQAEDSKALQQERDAWVQAIHKLCLEWKRKSQIEDMHMGVMDLQGHDIDEDAEDTLPAGGQADVESRSSGGLSFPGSNMNQRDPPAEYANADPISFGGNHASAGDGSQSRPTAENAKPVAKPRIKSANIMPTSPVPSPAVPGPALLPPTTPLRSPRTTAFTPSSPLSSPDPPLRSVSSIVPQYPLPEPVSSTQAGPPPPRIPPPPPLPTNFKKNPTKPNTKAFHWDLFGSDMVMMSLFITEDTAFTTEFKR